MDQNNNSRSDTNNNNGNANQQQNVHLHMHHVCNCQNGGVYPAYYPAVGYRTPLPSLVPFHTPSAVARPYLQHYQYTQFNVGSQYAVPIGHLNGSSTSAYGPTANSVSNTVDLVYNNNNGANNIKEKRDIREDGSGDVVQVERVNEPPEGYDYGQITPPANELLIGNISDSAIQENFVKFLEKSCLTAEQIAYRNRNRPCFRNIQNLCIRTRSEILKPCTTISNIHSQGIPWATKDFIYAFVRLTNCWHILKGYWDNRDGSSLGKIEKELTPEFRACYVRWEKETIELAGQLTKIFYNLDTNLNSATSAAAVYASNNLIPPQLNIVKNAPEDTIKKQSAPVSETDTINSSTTGKNVRGILHLATNETSNTETVDQANQTYAGDFCVKDDEYDSEEERTRRVYMKPGSYNVPKKGLEVITACSNSPRAIEFLDTAQNVNKVREAATDRYWTNILLSAGKKLTQEYKNLSEEDDKCNNIPSDGDRNVPAASVNVQEWLVSSNFADFIEPSQVPTMQGLKSYYMENAFDILPQLDNPPITIEKKSLTIPSMAQPNQIPKSSINHSNNVILESTRIFPNQSCINSSDREGQNNLLNPYEVKGGGLTEIGQCLSEGLVESLKGNRRNNAEMVDNIEKVLQKIRNLEYAYINEVVRDLRYIIKVCAKVDIHNGSWFSQKLDLLLSENFISYDFNSIKGDPNEQVGPLKNGASLLFNNDCDPCDQFL